MSLKQYLIIMTIGAVFCWVAWGVVIMNVDPFLDSGLGFIFFYTSLFFALLGTLSLFSFLTRYYFSKLDLPLFRFVQRSFRDAFFVSLILTGLLFLQGLGYLRWWNIGIVGMFIILIIIFKFSKSTPNSSVNNIKQ